jgi:hypothetical protein
VFQILISIFSFCIEKKQKTLALDCSPTRYFFNSESTNFASNSWIFPEFSKNAAVAQPLGG